MTDIRRITCPNLGANQNSIHASYDLHTSTGVLTIQSKESDSTYILNAQSWEKLLFCIGSDGSFLEHFEALDLSNMSGSIEKKLDTVRKSFEVIL